MYTLFRMLLVIEVHVKYNNWKTTQCHYYTLFYNEITLGSCISGSNNSDTNLIRKEYCRDFHEIVRIVIKV